jgi:hypothetical protein
MTDHPLATGYDLPACFSENYAEARRRFLAAVHATPPTELKSYVNPHRGPLGEELATDVAWFGPADAKKLLVLQTATHGVEGFCGSASVIDLLRINAQRHLPRGVALMIIHAINPHGFAWIRRVTEEGVDLNRNFVDFAKKLPENPGYDELADAFVPRELSGPIFDAAEARIAAYRERVGEKLFRVARSSGQWKHPTGLFFGGFEPTWSHRTIVRILADFDLLARDEIGVIDYHTGLGSYGFGDPICSQAGSKIAMDRMRRWWGDSFIEGLTGTSGSVVPQGINEHGWMARLGDRVSFVAVEYGTYSQDAGRRALREDHWLHAYGKVDWSSPETQRIKRQLKRHFCPDGEDWREMVIFRSRQLVRRALAGLS